MGFRVIVIRKSVGWGLGGGVAWGLLKREHLLIAHRNCFQGAHLVSKRERLKKREPHKNREQLKKREQFMKRKQLKTCENGATSEVSRTFALDQIRSIAALSDRDCRQRTHLVCGSGFEV